MSEADTLRLQIRRDIVLDTLGNTLLGLGLYAWFGHGSWVPAWMRSEAFVVCAVATGLLNLIHFPRRLARLRRWQELRNDEDDRRR